MKSPCVPAVSKITHKLCPEGDRRYSPELCQEVCEWSGSSIIRYGSLLSGHVLFTSVSSATISCLENTWVIYMILLLIICVSTQVYQCLLIQIQTLRSCSTLRCTLSSALSVCYSSYFNPSGSKASALVNHKECFHQCDGNNYWYAVSD